MDHLLFDSKDDPFVDLSKVDRRSLEKIVENNYLFSKFHSINSVESKFKTLNKNSKNFENFNRLDNCETNLYINKLNETCSQIKDDQQRKFKYKNDLNFHKLTSSVLRTLDQSADRVRKTKLNDNDKMNIKMEPAVNSCDTHFEFYQGDCCQDNKIKQFQRIRQSVKYNARKYFENNHRFRQFYFNQYQICSPNQHYEKHFIKPIKYSFIHSKEQNISSKSVPEVYSSLKQQVLLSNFEFDSNLDCNLISDHDSNKFKFDYLIKLRKCDSSYSINLMSRSKKYLPSIYNYFILILMLFCLVSPLSAMTTLFSNGGTKTKPNNQTTSSTINQNVDRLNDQLNSVSSPPTIALSKSSSTFTSTTPTSKSISSSIINSKNRTNRAIITTSPKRLDTTNLLTTTRSNSQLNDSSIRHSTQTQSLPYNYNYSSSHQKVPFKKSNESGIFFTNRSSNLSLPILKPIVANHTHQQINHQSRIVITRNQQPKIESTNKQQQHFKQLNVTTVLNDLNAQASQSLNSNSLSSSRNNLVKNDRDDSKSTESKSNDSKFENRMEASNRRSSTQIETNLPETFYQQTKKRLIATSSNTNGIALAQIRNPVLSSILKDVRPPSVSYSSIASSSSTSSSSISPKTSNHINKKQFTRITPNSIQILPAPVSTFSTNTSPTPIKRPLTISSINKDSVATKDTTTIITKDMIKDQLNKERVVTPGSVYVVHHHHLVSGDQANSDRQQQQNKYTILSSTESSKSKNYYKNEDEDDRVSTASIFFDDEPANNLDRSNSLDKASFEKSNFEKSNLVDKGTLDLSMLLKKEFDEQSNNKIIPRDQLNSQYGTSNLNLFALLPTATTVTAITPITSSSTVGHDRSLFNKDPSVFSTTVRSIKVDLNRQNNGQQNSVRTATIEKLNSANKIYGQRESLNDIWRSTNGHARVPTTITTIKDTTNNLTNNNVVDMKQFQLNLAKTAVRENPRFKNENSSKDNSIKNTISTLTTTTAPTNVNSQSKPTLTRFNQNKNKQQLDTNLFKYVNKNQLDDNKMMDNVINSLDNSNNGLDASDSNQIYNRTMLMNDLKDYKDRHSKKSSNETSLNTEDVLIRPVNDENEELLNNALGSADSPSNRESYRLTTERLAYILIGSCCAISIFCLIVVAFSIRCRDMCDEYKQWKNAEKLALFNYRYQQHQQQQQRNHRLKLHQMAAFGNLVSESNSSSSQLISGSNGNNAAAVGALTNISRPIFGPSCCCCPAGANLNGNNDKKHNNNNSNNINNNNSKHNEQANYHFHPCPRGRLPFGAASSVFARFNANNQLGNAATAAQLNENNENSLELLDEENDTLNDSLTDEFTTSKIKTTHQNGRANLNGPSTTNQATSNGVCLQCTCEDSFEDEESDLGSLSQVPTAIKNTSNQQYLKPNQLINHTHAKHHFNISSSNVNNNNHHHHHINHHLNHNNQNKNKRGVYQPMDNNWIQSSMIVDELHRKHNHRLINNQAKRKN